MTSRSDDVIRDLFHCCALIAFVEQAMEEGGVPNSEATRLRACRLYDRELKRINAEKTASAIVADDAADRDIA